MDKNDYQICSVESQASSNTHCQVICCRFNAILRLYKWWNAGNNVNSSVPQEGKFYPLEMPLVIVLLILANFSCFKEVSYFNTSMYVCMYVCTYACIHLSMIYHLSVFYLPIIYLSIIHLSLLLDDPLKGFNISVFFKNE